MTFVASASTFRHCQDSESIAAIVERVIATHRAIDRAAQRQMPVRRVRVDRRLHDRIHIQIPVYLTAVVERDGVVECLDEPVIGVTRDLGIQGVGFSYDRPLKSKLILAEFDICKGTPVRLLVTRKWKKTAAAFSYVSGGVFTGMLIED
jgi:hypothetical protein